MSVEELNVDWSQFTGHVTINVSIIAKQDAPVLLVIYDDKNKVVLNEYYNQALIQVPISILYKGTFRYEAFIDGKLVKSGGLLI